MDIFLFEYATAGGAWDQWHRPDLVDELLGEGQAMRGALTDDLLAAGHRVLALEPARDSPRQPANRGRFFELALSADAVVLLAPEIGGILLSLAQQVEQHGAMLVSPPSCFVEIATNKHRTAELLRAAKVAVPHGVLLPAGARIDRAHLPWSGVTICKPVDGAGSWGVQRCCQPTIGPFAYAVRIEPFIEGAAASVAVLSGPRDTIALAACRQHLGGSSGFCYCGGSVPLPEEWSHRAQALALRAMAAMPPTKGYAGVDLILGSATDGSRDVVIEINPRLTTSYVGLRRVYRSNLAAAWLAIAAGEAVELERVHPGQILEFFSDGTVREQAGESPIL